MSIVWSLTKAQRILCPLQPPHPPPWNVGCAELNIFKLLKNSLKCFLLTVICNPLPSLFVLIFLGIWSQLLLLWRLRWASHWAALPSLCFTLIDHLHHSAVNPQFPWSFLFVWVAKHNSLCCTSGPPPPPKFILLFRKKAHLLKSPY